MVMNCAVPKNTPKCDGSATPGMAYSLISQKFAVDNTCSSYEGLELDCRAVNVCRACHSQGCRPVPDGEYLTYNIDSHGEVHHHADDSWPCFLLFGLYQVQRHFSEFISQEACVEFHIGWRERCYTKIDWWARTCCVWCMHWWPIQGLLVWYYGVKWGPVSLHRARSLRWSCGVWNPWREEILVNQKQVAWDKKCRYKELLVICLYMYGEICWVCQSILVCNTFGLWWTVMAPIGVLMDGH